MAALITVLLGLALWELRIGSGLTHWSFDLPVILGPRVTPEEVVIVKIDELSINELTQPWPDWDRDLHTGLLGKVTADRASLVVFDVYFPQSKPQSNDVELARAIKANGHVVLAGDYSPLPGFKGATTLRPLDTLRQAAADWGVSLVELDTDLAVRKHYPGTDTFPSLAWAAATVAGAPVTKIPEARFTERWMRYYGDEGTLPSLSYCFALEKPPGFFKDKTVFIGGKPKTQFVLDETDEFQTPFTHLDGPFMPGVEIEATTFLNLLRDEWLTRMSTGLQVLLLVVCGAWFGFGLSLFRPVPGAGIAVLGMLLTAIAACLLFWYAQVWFSWLFIAGAQIPCAWACAVVWHTQKLFREKTALEEKLATTVLTPVPQTGSSGVPQVVLSPLGVSPGVSPGAVPPMAADTSATRGVAVIPDHDVLRSIGKGAYGEVYLARNAVGLYHAVKVIYRQQFKEEAPYEREFRGIQKYMPVSRNHPSLVNLLHVGRNNEAGYFYYIMELGDDEASGTKIDPLRYSPRNLSKDLKRRGSLPVAECLQLSLALTGALDYLHREQLIHRDIKPANIIFVKGVPKFADIGLVTDIAAQGHDVTYIGTEGYIAPEGPGTPAADVYSLGMVMYEAATGMDRHYFPELPDTLTSRPDAKDLLRLNEIILKACQRELQERYQSAAQMHADLLRVQTETKTDTAA